jgi:predicted amidohydrolase YtcJ
MPDRRSVLLGLAAAAFAAGCDARTTNPSRPEPADTADLIFYNAAVLTMDPALPRAQAVGIVGDRIVAVGSDSDALRLRGSRTRVVDLGGRTVLPGFNETHGHWIGDRDQPWGAPGPLHPAQPDAPAAIQQALAVGWTSLSEMFVSQQRLDELRAVDSGTGLRIRVNAYLPVNYLSDHFGFWFGDYVPGHEYSPYLRLAGAKLFVDRAAPSSMYLSAPHNDTGRYGEVYWKQAQLTDMVTLLFRRGWQVAAHSAGDGAHDLLLNAIEDGRRAVPIAPGRPRIEHAVVLRTDQIERFAALGVLASIQFTWLTSDWLVLDELRTIEATLGPERIGWAGRWRDLLDAGVRVAGGTDTPWTGATPLQAIYEAVTRVGFSGRPATAWMAPQRITVAEALRLLTIDAAYATFQEQVKGSIERGKFADLVVLSANPLEVPVTALPSLEVVMTIVGGRVEFCAPTAGSLCP